eukprot:1147984-Pelagomonas_calceolata.AAC.1
MGLTLGAQQTMCETRTFKKDNSAKKYRQAQSSSYLYLIIVMALHAGWAPQQSCELHAGWAPQQSCELHTGWAPQQSFGV